MQYLRYSVAIYFAAMIVTTTLATTASAEAMKLEVLSLKHRPAENLIMSLKPLLPAGAHITASGNQLIVRSTPSNLLELRRALAVLDSPLAQLLISLKRGQNTAVQQQHNQINGTIRQGNISLSTNKQTKELTTTSNTRVVVRRGATNSQQNGIQQIRATEGYPAYIHIGEQVPLVTTQYNQHNGDRTVLRSYKDVLSGFYATPRLVGENQVLIEIETSNNHKKHNTIKTETYQGVVRGHLGKWIPIANLQQTNKTKDKALNRYNRTSDVQRLNLYLKVERQ